MKRISILLFALLIAVSFVTVSCSYGVFAEDIDTNLIVGKWYSGSDERSGTLIDLKENGRYYYEVRAFGHVEATASGRWTVTGKNLHLWNLLEQINDPEGFEQFAFSLSTDSEGRSVMKANLTLIRSKRFVKIEEYAPSISSEPAAAVAPSADTTGAADAEAIQSIDGIWLSSGITAVISGSNVTIIENGNVYNARIESIDSNAISLSSDNSALSMFKKIFYSVVEDKLTIIAVDNPSIIISFDRNHL